MTTEKTFTITASSYTLKPWFGEIMEVSSSLPPSPTLMDLSRAVFKTGLSYDEREAWADIAHEIKDYMGVDNLCEVNIAIEL